MPANLMLGQYKILAVIGYTLFGLGLAFYATPSTDAALSNLPAAQGGSGSGIYKMASSLGAAFGVAISAAIFTALGGQQRERALAGGRDHLPGRQDNLAVREAAFVALGFNVLMVVVAIVSIMLTVPRGREDRTTERGPAALRRHAQPTPRSRPASPAHRPRRSLPALSLTGEEQARAH